MEASQKLEMLLDYLKIKILPFSTIVKQGSQTFYDIRSGKIQSFSLDVANKIVEAFPEINREWLLGSDANMLKPAPVLRTSKDNGQVDAVGEQIQKVLSRKKKADTVKAIANDNYMMVEYQDLATAAGSLGGGEIEQLPETKKRLVPREYENGYFLVVRVDGDSMDDGSKYSIPNGTEILIKEYFLDNGDTLPIRNNLFVIVSKDGTVFKQIIKHVPGEYIVCHSYNPRFKDFKIPMEDIIQIFIYRKIVSFRPDIPDITQ